MWSTRANLLLTVTMMTLAIAVTDGRILRFPFKKEVSLNGQFNLTIRWELDWVGQSVDIGVVLDVNDTLR
uniref:Uncharacterized protein n=1 Tax=Plectus sambesii TaxID=2011161 RepID=A0A914V1L8_9BILA